MENENVQKNKQKGRKGIIIFVFILLIIIVIGVYIAMNMPKKEVEVYKEPEIVVIDLENPIKILKSTKTNKVDIYNENIIAEIPGINATVKGAKELNAKILSDYSQIVDEIKKGAPYIISYEYSYSTEFKYVILNITTLLDNNKNIKTYIYDVKQDREVFISELYEKYNFTVEKLKNRLVSWNLVNNDIQNIENKKVEEKIFLHSMEKEKMIIGYVDNLDIKYVTFNINEKNAEHIITDGINVKEEKGISTVGNNKLYVNIKLPKIKLETANARALNDKINNIYEQIQEYYDLLAPDRNIPNTQSGQALGYELVIDNSYEINYKYSYIDEMGLVYVTITKNTISGKDDQKTGQTKKIRTNYISYLYNIAEDREENLEKLFELYGTNKQDIAIKVIENNIKEKESIEKASQNISNYSILLFSKNKLVINLKVDDNLYEVEYERQN